ncbi:hypothetical protein F5B20DRAFT_588541 [Whalleya microplaca]|nr:hypothetical protein F5B20DRAFT_588541 [Whalleya microplaca]
MDATTTTTATIMSPTATTSQGPTSPQAGIPNGIQCLVEKWHSNEQCVIAPSWPTSLSLIHWFIAFLLGIAYDIMCVVIKRYDQRIERRRNVLPIANVKAPPDDSPPPNTDTSPNEADDINDNASTASTSSTNMQSPTRCYSSQANTVVASSASTPFGGFDGTNETKTTNSVSSKGDQPAKQSRRQKIGESSIRVFLLTLRTVFSTLSMLMTIYYNGETTLCVLGGTVVGHIIAEIF